jgi:hypothetical protein
MKIVIFASLLLASVLLVSTFDLREGQRSDDRLDRRDNRIDRVVRDNRVDRLGGEESMRRNDLERRQEREQFGRNERLERTDRDGQEDREDRRQMEREDERRESRTLNRVDNRRERIELSRRDNRDFGRQARREQAEVTASNPLTSLFSVNTVLVLALLAYVNSAVSSKQAAHFFHSFKRSMTA